jgi:hypothetical protein
MRSELIAPCGMNCALCIGYFGYNMNGKKRSVSCIGCRPRNKNCAFVKKKCELLSNDKVEFYFVCSDFPCEQLQKLDRRYTKKYNIIMIANLIFIRKHGMEDFLKQQKVKYSCPECGETICVHNGVCYNCEGKNK